jgi:hypothetical protein
MPSGAAPAGEVCHARGRPDPGSAAVPAPVRAAPVRGYAPAFSTAPDSATVLSVSPVAVSGEHEGKREAHGWEREDLGSALDPTGMGSGEGNLGSQQICWVG